MRYNRLSMALIAILLTIACQPLEHAVYMPSVYGIGVCHSVPSARPHVAISWAYSTTLGVHWAKLEPERGIYDFSLLDKRVKKWSLSELIAWIGVQSMGVGVDGERKAPMWLFDEGAVWISGSCANDGMIPPWDEVYQERLQLLLAAINSHIAGWDEEYQAAIAGVIAMSGGMYGEMQVASCGAKEAMKAHYGLTDTQFNALYGDAIVELADYYFAAFPDTNIMWQVGYCTTTADAALEQGIVDYMVILHSDRLFVKWAGLAPVCGLDWQRRANEHYQGMFKQLSDIGIRVGYEPAKLGRYQTPVGSGAWDPAKFEEVFAVAENSGASFMCFQPVMLPGLFGVPGWLAFDAALEANAPASQPTPTATLSAVVEHKGGVAWPGAPVALADGLVNLGVNAVHHWNYSEARLALMEERGIEYLPHIWGCGVTDNSWDTIDLAAIAAFAEAHPGLRWLIFNEPDNIDQSNCSPSVAADVHHDVYHTLKAADSTALVYCCGTSGHEAHQMWMSAFLHAYSEKYGVAAPMDGVHLHFYGDYERRHGFMEVQSKIMDTAAFYARQWPDQLGKKLWVVSEWGVLSDKRDGPYEVEKTAAYLRNMWNWLESKDWVETHFWFSTWVGEGGANSGNLFTDRANLTMVGSAWAECAHGVPPPTASPTLPISPLPTPTTTFTPSPTATPTNTPLPTTTPTPTKTPVPTATRTLVPTITATSTATATVTPTPSPTPTHVVIRWLCEFNMTTLELVCKPVPSEAP